MSVRIRAYAGLAVIVVAVACNDANKHPRGDSTVAQSPTPATATATSRVDTAHVDTVHVADWEQFDYASHVIAKSDLTPLPLVELQHIRAIIFGKHGRVFQDTTLQRWLASRPWYHADTSFTNARLAGQESVNLDLVREAEAAKHTLVESGDMRFYQNRVLTTAMLGTHTPQDWEVLEAEVLAEHGFVFDKAEDREDPDEPPSALQKYFDERYWYVHHPEFDAHSLSAIEQANRDTITLAMTRQQGRALSPGMMNLFRTNALSEQMLKGVAIADLRLLRNEVYARHGRIFQTAWLGDFFRSFPWYRPRADFSDAELSPMERANVALITKREQQLHEELGTRLLGIADVRGLRPDDARLLRNEIYARHGRRFQDPRLQKYFASFGWYHPTDTFRENQLNDTERKNVTLISQYESGQFTEG
jgi:hypothetical protein